MIVPPSFIYWTGVVLVWWLIGPTVDRAVEKTILRHQNPMVWNLAPFARLVVALIWPGLPVLVLLSTLSKDK